MLEAMERTAKLLEANGINWKYDEFVVVSEDFQSLFLTTKNRGNNVGQQRMELVFKGLQFSQPLKRAILHTTSASGTKHWHEGGMEMEWHFHPDIGVNLSVLPATH
jgi:hypothetical protein